MCVLFIYLFIYFFPLSLFFFFFFNDTATTEIYTLSLHDALSDLRLRHRRSRAHGRALRRSSRGRKRRDRVRSEEHTSELQSPCNLVCRLLLEKKKKQNITCNALNEVT